MASVKQLDGREILLSSSVSRRSLREKKRTSRRRVSVLRSEQADGGVQNPEVTAEMDMFEKVERDGEKKRKKSMW